MREIVLDASVVVKWIFPERRGEVQVGEAIALLEALRDGTIRVTQPAHWLAEVAATATRLDADVARIAIPLLHAMELPQIGDLTIYAHAMKIAARLEHHLFDTLYHAVALEHGGAILVTADDAYYRKARRLGAIARLSDFSLG